MSLKQKLMILFLGLFLLNNNNVINAATFKLTKPDIRVIWNPNPVEQKISKYVVLWGTNKGAPYQNAIDILNGLTYCDITLPGNNTYYITVYAQNEDGNNGPMSVEHVVIIGPPVTVAPGKVTGVKITKKPVN